MSAIAALILLLFSAGQGATVAAVDDKSLCSSSQPPVERTQNCRPAVKLGTMGTLPRWLRQAPQSIDDALKSLEDKDATSRQPASAEE